VTPTSAQSGSSIRGTTSSGGRTATAGAFYLYEGRASEEQDHLGALLLPFIVRPMSLRGRSISLPAAARRDTIPITSISTGSASTARPYV